MVNTSSSRVVRTLPYADPRGSFPIFLHFFLFFFSHYVKENDRRMTGGGPKPSCEAVQDTRGPACPAPQRSGFTPTFHLASLHSALHSLGVSGQPLSTALYL